MPTDDDPDYVTAKNAIARWRMNCPEPASHLTPNAFRRLAAEIVVVISEARESGAEAERDRIAALIRGESLER